MLDVNLVGATTKMAIITLRPGQTVFSEAGKFLFSSADVVMETKLSQPSDSGASDQASGGFGGLLRGAVDAGKRMIAGESFAFCHFHTQSPEGLLAFAGIIPGEMRVLELDPSTTWYAEKDAFVAAEGGVHFDIAFSGLRNGLRGGEGFILEKFTGTGSLLVAGAGDFIDVNPADYGGKLRVDTGCVVAWDQGITFDVERVGSLNRQGVMNAVFGGEGFSQATLSGNGRVILQSLTLGALRAALNTSTSGEAHGDQNGNTGLGAIGGILGR